MSGRPGSSVPNLVTPILMLAVLCLVIAYAGGYFHAVLEHRPACAGEPS